MELRIYQIDAFAEKPFTGNPAAVIVLDEWLPKEVMQNIAMENNLSETAFVVQEGNIYNIRYFAPVEEIELCGHATLASSYVLFKILKKEVDRLTFRTQTRGDLYVDFKDEVLTLDFPVDELQNAEIPEGTIESLKAMPSEAYWGKTDLMLVFESEEIIRKMEPNFEMLKAVKARGIMVTSKGNDVDFVSRFFAPLSGINEDPVTGSAHTTLIPYWSKKLGKSIMTAKQLSKRGGTLYCEHRIDRVKIGGKAIHYLTGTISI